MIAAAAVPHPETTAARGLPPVAEATVSRLCTTDGRCLAVGADETLRATREATPSAPVALIRIACMPRVGFMLVAHGSTPFRIAGGAFREVLHPWRLREGNDGMALHEPAYGQALAHADGSLTLPPLGTTDAPSRFRLLLLTPREVTGATAAVAGEIARLAPAALSGPDMLDAMERVLTPATADIMQALMRLLPPDQLQWLGRALPDHPEHLARLAAAYPGDVWAREGLPRLRDWLLRRSPAVPERISRRLDGLALSGIDGRPTSIGHALGAAARASVAPRRAVCVVATARNEGLYLLEWIAHHRMIGAEAIFIYSNDNADGSDDLLRALARAGEITWIESELDEGAAAQPKAYGHAFGLLPQVLDYRWSLVVDLDEFFGFDTARFHSLPDYVAWQETQPVDAIALNWLVFGSGGAVDWTDAPLAERFTMRLPWTDAHVKCISRTNLGVHSRPHHPCFDPSRRAVLRDSEGALHRWEDDVSISAAPRAERAWIAHYFLKSAREFVWKSSRNRGNHALVRDTGMGQVEGEFAELFARQHNDAAMLRDTRMQQYVPGIRAEIEHLLALPDVANAQRAAREKYRAGVNAIILGGLSATSGPAASPARRRLLDLCEMPERARASVAMR